MECTSPNTAVFVSVVATSTLSLTGLAATFTIGAAAWTVVCLKVLLSLSAIVGLLEDVVDPTLIGIAVVNLRAEFDVWKVGWIGVEDRLGLVVCDARGA